MSQAHFEVDTIVDRSFKQKASISIDRDTGMVTIRAKNSHQVYEMSIEEVVTLVVQATCRKKAAENPPKRRKLVNRGLLRF